jgi:hypothetical protein
MMMRVRILSVNGRRDIGLAVSRDYFQMSPAQFGSYIREVHALLVKELAEVGVDYDALAPALVPSTTKNELALLFNSNLVDDGLYGYEIAERVIPLLDLHATHAYLSGDLLQSVADVRALALEAGGVFIEGRPWGDQWIYCVYVNSLSAAQKDRIVAAMGKYQPFLGHVQTSYGSRFKTVLGATLPTSFIKHGTKVIVDHGMDEPWISDSNEIGFAFEENGLEIVGVNSALYSPLLTYKIESLAQPRYTEDVLISLNAISEAPLPLADFEVVLSDGKYGYVQTKKKELLEIAGLLKLSAADLAARIRAEIENNSIYRLQFNPDDTVQFSIVIEIPRSDDHPVKLAVGLKYDPIGRALFVVTVT